MRRESHKLCERPKRAILVQGDEFVANYRQREDGELAFPLIAPKADIKSGLPKKVWNAKIGRIVTARSFSIMKRIPVRPSAEQKASLVEPRPEIDQNWRCRQKAILRKPDAEPAQLAREVVWSGRSYGAETNTIDRSYARFFKPRTSGGGEKAYRPEPGISYWSDTPGGRDKPAHVRIAEVKAATVKQKLAGKFRKRLDPAEAAIRDLYNRLNKWETRLGIALDEYQGNPCRETRQAVNMMRSQLPPFELLMRMAASDRRIEVLVYGIIGFYDDWSLVCHRPTANAKLYISWPSLPRGRGELVRRWEQTVWTVMIDGEEQRHLERVRWTSPEGAGMTALDWEAARLGGYYKLPAGRRVGDRLRREAREFGWSFVYDTHDGKPIRMLIPYVPGENRRAMITIGRRRIGYTHRFPGTERFVPAAIETSGTIEFLYKSHLKARGDKVTAFTAADKTECQTRGQNAPIVQYRTSKLAFARRDLRIRDERVTELLPGYHNFSGKKLSVVGRYYAYSVKHRQERARRKAKRELNHAISLIRHIMGDADAVALMKKLSADKVLKLGRKIAESHLII